MIGFFAGAMLGLIYLFKYLLKVIKKQKLKEAINKLTIELNLDNLDSIEAENKVNEVNELLKNLNNPQNNIKDKKRLGFVDNLFVL